MDTTTTLVLLLTIVLVVHLIEEINTGFRQRFPLGEMPRPLFVGINVAVYAFCFATLVLSAQGNEVAIPLAWVFAVAMLLNGLGHIWIMVVRRQYFPGGITAFMILLVSGHLISHLMSIRGGKMISLKTHLAVYLILALLLLVTAYVVFRRIVRRDYLYRCRLTRLSSLLQLLVFAGLMSFPYLFNPPEWPWFWRLEGPAGSQLRILGLALIVSGFVIAFGTMAWFGVRRAFGFEVKGLIRIGPYRITRNPQILGGYLLVIGTTVQWPSWYALGWIVLYGLIGHWMVITEEEHLRAEFGEEYERYCEQTPRYLLNT